MTAACLPDGQLAEAVCLRCGAVYSTPDPWREQFCSDACRRERRRERERERETRRVCALTPDDRLRVRERCAAWHEQRGGKSGSRPWLAGPPPFAEHLPGATMAISIAPAPRFPIALRNTRALHGVLTAILDVGHGPRFPSFSLRQTDLAPSGWAVHWWRQEGLRLARQSFDVQLFGKPVTVSFGPAVRMRAPRIARRGHRRLRVETITPVSIVASGRTVERTSVSAANLRGTLAGEWLHRFGLMYLKERDLVQIEVLKVRREQEARVDLGGKYGTVLGWEGVFDVDTNAPGHWLFETAARIGMGSRTAFGFGRVKVAEVATTPRGGGA